MRALRVDDWAVPAVKADWRAPWVQVCALLVVAVAFGGGGVGFGLANLVVQLAALLVLALNPVAVFAFFRTAPRGLVILVALSLCVPVLQLVPLPPALWAALPGREILSESLDLVGAENAWRPFTVDANRTFVTFLSMLPVLAVLALTARLSPQELGSLLWAIVLMGVACALIGAMQLATGNAVGTFYPGGLERSDLYGTFASHNATGLFFDIALAALFALPRDEKGRKGRERGFVLRLVIGAVLVVAVVLTRSRSSMALMLLVMAFGAVRQWMTARRHWRRSTYLAVAAGAALLVAGGVTFAAKSYRVQSSFQRFDDLEDARPHIWEDALSTAHRYWPVGAGMGTFDEVFQVDESLEYLDAKRAGRAHNDYLEIAIETGGLGLLLIAGWLLWVGAAVRRAGKGSMRWQGFGAGVALGLVALQSAMDYPLRNQTTLVVAAILIGMLASPHLRAERTSEQNRQRP